jgi:hypothetical protein
MQHGHDQEVPVKMYRSDDRLTVAAPTSLTGLSVG